jgi:molybdopterin-binding protein
MISLRRVRARAGAFLLGELSVEVAQGAWVIVLGPAGAGKTTLLELIAGVRPIDGGQMLLRGRDVAGVPAEHRGVGLVYQHGFLFPHLDVSANVRYGASDPRYADEIAQRFGVDSLRARPVRSLSGGERQLVALARALATHPDLLLLDEPFAALDPRGRSRVQLELRALQRAQGITVLHVTHDFGEAGILGDLALLMEGGRLVQVDEPAALFRHPATSAAAEFLGAENIFAGTAHRGDASAGDAPEVITFRTGSLELSAIGTLANGAAHAVIRGEDVTLFNAGSGHGSARNVLEALVREITPAGVVARIALDVDGIPLVAVITAASVRDLGLEPGTRVQASIKATAVHLC